MKKRVVVLSSCLLMGLNVAPLQSMKPGGPPPPKPGSKPPPGGAPGGSNQPPGGPTTPSVAIPSSLFKNYPNDQAPFKKLVQGLGLLWIGATEDEKEYYIAAYLLDKDTFVKAVGSAVKLLNASKTAVGDKEKKVWLDGARTTLKALILDKGVYRKNVQDKAAELNPDKKKDTPKAEYPFETDIFYGKYEQEKDDFLHNVVEQVSPDLWKKLGTPDKNRLTTAYLIDKSIFSNIIKEVQKIVESLKTINLLDKTRRNEVLANAKAKLLEIVQSKEGALDKKFEELKKANPHLKTEAKLEITKENAPKELEKELVKFKKITQGGPLNPIAFKDKMVKLVDQYKSFIDGLDEKKVEEIYKKIDLKNLPQEPVAPSQPTSNAPASAENVDTFARALRSV